MDGSNTRNSPGKTVSLRNTLQRSLPVSQRRIKNLALKALKDLGLASWRIDFSFVGDRRMRALNREYHRTDLPTDVLAFDYGDRRADIIISLDTARRNSRLYKTKFKDEVLLYVIHGILHLAGYRDLDRGGRKKMFEKQEELLKQARWLS